MPLCQFREGSRNACEQETIIAQTVVASVNNYDSGDGLHSKLALQYGGGTGIVDNHSALATLKKDGLVIVNEDQKTISISQSCLLTLLGYYAAKLPPKSVEGKRNLRLSQ